jgi:hypothetical protein
MIFPSKEELRIYVFYCPMCSTNYVKFSDHGHYCFVSHPPGTCCHSHENSVKEATIDKILKLLESEENKEPT